MKISVYNCLLLLDDNDNHYVQVFMNLSSSFELIKKALAQEEFNLYEYLLKLMKEKDKERARKDVNIDEVNIQVMKF